MTSEIIFIKKYPNRRLYNTSTSQYVTLEDLFLMIKENINFRVEDTKTKEDLTKTILTQIIFEQEAKGYNLLAEAFLKQIITMYGNNLQNLFSFYLEESVNNFSNNIDAWANNEAGYKDKNLEAYREVVSQSMNYYRNFFNIFSNAAFHNPMSQAWSENKGKTPENPRDSNNDKG